MSKTELKPCPFCGGHAHVITAFDGKQNKYVPSCSVCFSDNNGLYDTCEDAVKAWNTRPLEEKLEKIIEEAGEEIEELKEQLEEIEGFAQEVMELSGITDELTSYDIENFGVSASNVEDAFRRKFLGDEDNEVKS